jgi:hypothetical protein
MSGNVATSQSQQKNIHVVPSVGGLCELVYELFDPPTYKACMEQSDFVCRLS